MSPRINEEPGLPAWKYPGHVERVLGKRPEVIEAERSIAALEPLVPCHVRALYPRSPHILGQNPRGTSYGRSFRSLEYRRRVGLVAADDRQDLRVVALCALLVAVLCAWMFWNANFAKP